MYLDIVAGVEPINKKRVLLTGARGVGKTSLLERYINDTFSHDLEKTSDIITYEYDKYIFYDIPGDTFLPLYIITHEVDIVIMVVRRDMPITIKCVKGAIEYMKRSFPNITCIVCCVASDLPSLVNENYLSYYTNNTNYIEVSSKNGDNFHSLITQLYMS